MTEPILELRGVTKSFGTLDVLKGIDLDVQKGQMICLIGSSGSGKSTLLRCLNLLEPIDDGEIRFKGRDISMPGFDPQPVRQKIGLVFQSFNLFPHMTAADNVMLAPRRVFRTPRSDLQAEVQELFSRFGLADRMTNYPDQLSGGQQQRVAIIRALAMKPDIMLFDEVTAALDPETVKEVLVTIKDLAAEGMTCILVTHEMGFAREVADHIYFTDRGVIVEHGPPATFFDGASDPRTREFLGQIL